MMIGVQSHTPYLRFAARLLPVALLGLLVDFLVVAWMYRSSLVKGPAAKDSRLDEPVPSGGWEKLPNGQPHTWLLRKSLAVTLATVVLFVTGLPIPLVALGAAAVLLVGRVRPEKVYRQINWSLLIMFAGLFVVVHAFQLHVLNWWDLEAWRFLADSPVGWLSLVSAGLSNLVSNVPAVLLCEPVVRALPVVNRETAWLALAMSSTFAGNLTVLGSVANLIVVEGARRGGIAITFWEYCRIGIPVTALTLLLEVAWLHWVVY
jgi:Na+/H+ antiporter NhaD/arsenite permease-like protein